MHAVMVLSSMSSILLPDMAPALAPIPARAPMAFFHTTPLGRIINRLTKDTVDVDKNLADFAAFFLRSLLQLLSTVALIGFETPFALPALVPILLFFYFLYAYFQARLGTLAACAMRGLDPLLHVPCAAQGPCSMCHALCRACERRHWRHCWRPAVPASVIAEVACGGCYPAAGKAWPEKLQITLMHDAIAVDQSVSAVNAAHDPRACAYLTREACPFPS